MNLRTLPLPALLVLYGALSGAGAKNSPARTIGSSGVSRKAIISGMSATPATVSFLATDPDLGAVTGTASTVTWSAVGGLLTNTWTLTVQAGVTSFSGCSTVPVSAVTVTCTSASATGILAGTGVCAAAFPLSTSPHQIASGTEGSVSGAYTVNITFTLTDMWKYVAAVSPACTLTLTYTANTP
jgi:hypothetical protein